jgi:hypothetical protein
LWPSRLIRRLIPDEHAIVVCGLGREFAWESGGDLRAVDAPELVVEFVDLLEDESHGAKIVGKKL